jgi:hypothetical protein
MADLALARGLVLDASMLINLLATQECAAILQALGVPCVAPEHAIGEVTRDPVSRRRFADGSRNSERFTPLTTYALRGESFERFLVLVGAPPPDGLGDGEAACIATAGELGYAICLDDKKARRICREAVRNVKLTWSADLIGHERVVAALGKKRSDSCFQMAQKYGRMPLPPHWRK